MMESPAQQTDARPFDQPDTPRQVVHPFLGFTRPTGIPVRALVAETWARRMASPSSLADASWLDVPANNHGFFSPVDYPFPEPGASDDAFVVGVFGGSAAQWFALLVGDALAAACELAEPRRVLVLNLANGGMKQPQQLQALSLFLSEGQRFDAVLDIDGFNEAALSFLNRDMGYEPSAPSIQHLAQLPFDLSGLRVKEHAEGLSDADLAAAIAGHWTRSSRLMHNLCRSQGIAVVQLLQPNQYASGKALTDEERRYAISETTPYRRGVEVAYPALRAAALELSRAGFPVIDATSAFDRERETIYVDNCCHFNLRGNRILLDIVADALLLGASRQFANEPPSTVEHAQESDSGADDEQNDYLYPMW